MPRRVLRASRSREAGGWPISSVERVGELRGFLAVLVERGIVQVEDHGCPQSEMTQVRGVRGAGVRVGERLHHEVEVVRLLDLLARAPLAARLAHEVAAVHVDRAGEAVERVVHGVDGVVAEHDDLTGIERAVVGLDDARAIVGVAPEELVLLAPGVDRDRGPHPVVVGEQRHPRRPHDVDDREVGRVVEEPRPPSLGASARVTSGALSTTRASTSRVARRGSVSDAAAMQSLISSSTSKVATGVSVRLSRTIPR